MSEIDMGSFTLGDVWASGVEVRVPGRFESEITLIEEEPRAACESNVVLWSDSKLLEVEVARNTGLVVTGKLFEASELTA